jgi:hypothetical protein
MHAITYIYSTHTLFFALALLSGLRPLSLSRHLPLMQEALLKHIESMANLSPCFHPLKMEKEIMLPTHL